MRNYPTSLLSALAVVALAGCAGSVPRTDGAPARADAPVASSADPAGRMAGYQVLNRYDDVIKVDGASVQQTVEYGFDYERSLTVRRFFDRAGTLMSEEELPTEFLRANDAESARMLELVRTHPQLGPMMAQPGLVVHRGGFVVREPGDPHCDLKSRCMRFIVSKPDGTTSHIHAVVDLVTDRVVYPFATNLTSPDPSGTPEKQE
jgi:hypothetical protein